MCCSVLDSPDATPVAQAFAVTGYCKSDASFRKLVITLLVHQEVSQMRIIEKTSPMAPTAITTRQVSPRATCLPNCYTNELQAAIFHDTRLCPQQSQRLPEDSHASLGAERVSRQGTRSGESLEMKLNRRRRRRGTPSDDGGRRLIAAAGTWEAEVVPMLLGALGHVGVGGALWRLPHRANCWVRLRS